MERGDAEVAWMRLGNGVRFVPGLPFADMVIFPSGAGLALLPVDLDGAEREEAFERFLGRFTLARYGSPEARAVLRSHLRGNFAAD